jgi:hypothetical protein
MRGAGASAPREHRIQFGPLVFEDCRGFLRLRAQPVETCRVIEVQNATRSRNGRPDSALSTNWHTAVRCQGHTTRTTRSTDMTSDVVDSKMAPIRS